MEFQYHWHNQFLNQISVALAEKIMKHSLIPAIDAKILEKLKGNKNMNKVEVQSNRDTKKKWIEIISMFFF